MVAAAMVVVGEVIAAGAISSGRGELAISVPSTLMWRKRGLELRGERTMEHEAGQYARILLLSTPTIAFTAHTELGEM